MMKKLLLVIIIPIIILSCDPQNIEESNNGFSVPNGVMIIQENGTYTIPQNSKYALFLHLPKEDQNYGFYGENEPGFNNSDMARFSIDIAPDQTSRSSYNQKKPLALSYSRPRSIKSSDVPFQAEEGSLFHVFDEGDVWEGIHIKANEEVIDAKCIYVTENAYVLIDNSSSYDDADLNRIIEVVDNFEKAYPSFRETFGTVSDIDENGKLLVVVANLGENLMGYMSPEDFYISENSNNGEIMYISLDVIQSPDQNLCESFNVTIIHELQHIVFTSKRVLNGLSEEPTWITEALSTFAEEYSGNEVFKEILVNRAAWLSWATGNNSIIEWLNDDDNDIQISYALSAFFFRYLVNRFGEDIIQKIYLCPYNDYRMVEYATGEDFGTLFYDFCLSLIVSGRGITDDPRYDVKEFYDGTLDFSLEEIFYEYYFPLSDYSSNMKPYSFVLFSLPPEVEEVTFQSENVLGLIL